MSLVRSDIETRIQALCAEAVVVKDEADVERLIVELRAALTEHIEQARKSLGAQAVVFATLDATLEMSARH